MKQSLKTLAMGFIAALFAVAANAQTATPATGAASAAAPAASAASAAGTPVKSLVGDPDPAKPAAGTATAKADRNGSHDDVKNVTATAKCEGDDDTKTHVVAKTQGKNAVAVAKCGDKPQPKAGAPKPKAQVAKADPLPGRLCTVTRVGAINCVGIPTPETRVELVDGPSVAAVVHPPLVVEDRRTPVAVAQASAAAVAAAPVAQATAVAAAPAAPVTLPAGQPGPRTVSYVNPVTGKTYTATVNSAAEETAWIGRMVDQCTADQKAKVAQELSGPRGANMPPAQKEAILATAKCIDTRRVAQQ